MGIAWRQVPGRGPGGRAGVRNATCGPYLGLRWVQHVGKAHRVKVRLKSIGSRGCHCWWASHGYNAAWAHWEGCRLSSGTVWLPGGTCREIGLGNGQQGVQLGKDENSNHVCVSRYGYGRAHSNSASWCCLLPAACSPLPPSPCVAAPRCGNARPRPPPAPSLAHPPPWAYPTAVAGPAVVHHCKSHRRSPALTGLSTGVQEATAGLVPWSRVGGTDRTADLDPSPRAKHGHCTCCTGASRRVVCSAECKGLLWTWARGVRRGCYSHTGRRRYTRSRRQRAASLLIVKLDNHVCQVLFASVAK